MEQTKSLSVLLREAAVKLEAEKNARIAAGLATLPAPPYMEDSAALTSVMKVIVKVMFECCQSGTLEINSGYIHIPGKRYCMLPHWLPDITYDGVEDDVDLAHKQLCHQQIVAAFRKQHPDVIIACDVYGKLTPKLVFKW